MALGVALDQRGPYAVEETRMDLVDATRDREMGLLIFPKLCKLRPRWLYSITDSSWERRSIDRTGNVLPVTDSWWPCQRSR